MQPVRKAIWYIEHRFRGELSLEAVAGRAGVSKYHLARAFAMATGMPVMRYVRARRLSEAAKLLADGADNILAVALEAGYGSHEAFTRAFRDQFGTAPEAVRAARSTQHLSLMEPISMTQSPNTDLAPPRMEERAAFTVAGLKQHYAAGQMAGIPAQWQRFAPYLGQIDGEVPGTAYGVVCDGDDEGNVDYMAGVEVTRTDDLPADFASIRIEPQRYAVFTHRGHVTGIGQTWMAIFNDGLPKAGLTMVRAPQFEQMDQRFDPETGNGEIEIWVPVKR